MKLNLKPSKPVSVGSFIGLCFMLLFGIAFAFLIGNVLVENDAPVPMYFVFGIFMIGWLGAVVFMLVYHFLNLKRAKGLSLVEIDTESGSLAEARSAIPCRRCAALKR
jgi:membrane protein YdbS with pleckstrin-like domain